MDQSFTEAKDTAIALKYLTEAKALLRQDDYSFKEVEELLLKASKSTRHETYLELARLYERHSIFDEALKWYMRKYNYSMLDKKDAMKVASWYEKGIGTEVDNNLAVKFYTGIAFSNDEALKGAIRLYKNKNTTYMRTSASGLMTPEKWEDEARERGVIEENQIDDKKIQKLEDAVRATFKNDPTIDEVIQSIYPERKKTRASSLFYVFRAIWIISFIVPFFYLSIQWAIASIVSVALVYPFLREVVYRPLSFLADTDTKTDILLGVSEAIIVILSIYIGSYYIQIPDNFLFIVGIVYLSNQLGRIYRSPDKSADYREFVELLGWSVIIVPYVLLLN
jgi:hypothetical protein